MEHATTARQASPRRLLVALTFIGFISLGLPDGLLGVAWPSIAASRGVGLDALGSLIVAFTLGYLATSVQSGRLLARLGVGSLLAISCLATALSLLGYALAPAWLLMLPLAALLGAGGGAIDAGLNAYAAAHYSPRTVTWLHACYGLGATAGPAIMTATLAARLPWQLGYALVGGGQLALAACFALSRGLWQNGAPAASAGQPAAGPSLATTLRLPAAWLSCLVFLLYTGLEVSLGQWSFTLLSLGRGLPETTAGQWVGAYWASLTVGRVLAGFLAARISPNALLWAGAVGALGGSALIWLDTAGSMLSLIGLLLAGLSLAPIFPALIATTQGRVGPAHTANTVGFQVSAAMLGGALLPWLISQLIAAAGVPAIAPAVAGAALLYLGLYAALAVRRTTG